MITNNEAGTCIKVTSREIEPHVQAEISRALRLGTKAAESPPERQPTTEPATVSDLLAGQGGFYVASRASIPERPAMWRRLRDEGWPITSTWIDEAGPGETHSFEELWQRIEAEIRSSVGVLLYCDEDDFPLKGALLECGIALGMGKPVAVAFDFTLDNSFRPIGSWVMHPLVSMHSTLAEARERLESHRATPASEIEQPNIRTLYLRAVDCHVRLRLNLGADNDPETINWEHHDERWIEWAKKRHAELTDLRAKLAAVERELSELRCKTSA
jgi:hypothetical protein